MGPTPRSEPARTAPNWEARFRAAIRALKGACDSVDIVYKSVAWRDADRKGIERLLLWHRATIDLPRTRAQVEEFSQLMEAPERVEQFDALVSRVRGPGASS